MTTRLLYMYGFPHEVDHIISRIQQMELSSKLQEQAVSPIKMCSTTIIQSSLWLKDLHSLLQIKQVMHLPCRLIDQPLGNLQVESLAGLELAMLHCEGKVVQDQVGSLDRETKQFYHIVWFLP